MKKKKTKHSKNKSLEQSSSASKDEHPASFSETCLNDKSFGDNRCTIQELKIELSDGRENFSKWISSNWKCIALLHPSLMSSLSIYNHVLIQSEKVNALCVAFPFKSIKKNIVFLPKDNLGFNNQDAVTVHPYVENIEEASEILISPNLNFDSIQNFTEIVFKILSNRFILEGMTMKFQFLDFIQEFKIIQIVAVKPKQDLTNSTMFQDSFLTDICQLSNLSLDESKELKLLSHPKKKNLDTSFDLHAFSSTPLSVPTQKRNEHDSAVKDEISISGDALFSAPSSKYYVISHKTKIVLLSSQEKKTKEISFPNFDQIVGLNAQLNFIKIFIKMAFGCEKYNSQTECGTLLFVGPAGTGKTLVMEAICKEYGFHSVRINWYEIYAKSLSEAENDLRLLFENAVDRSPSLILIDDFNYLCPSKNEAKATHLQIFNILSLLIEQLQNKKVLIIASTNDSDYDDMVLKAGGRMLHELKFQMPNHVERCKMLINLLNETQHSLTSEQVQECVELSRGFSGKDLMEVVSTAKNIQCLKNYSSLGAESNFDGTVSFDVLSMICKWKKPKILSTCSLKVKKVFWEDIGGMTDIKEKLKQLVEWPLKYPEAYKRFNIVPSKGVLMYGPPGCSKTMIAKALATECDLNFISRNTSDLFQKWVGESERAVRDLFAMARAKSPSIIFLDEIDALVAERGSCSSGSGVGDRIVTTLLTEIDGIEELHGVLIVAATNRPDMLDEALMRNGRINHFVYVPLPDLHARKEILKIQMKSRNIADDLDFEYLSEKTSGYTGAEIVNICNEAALQLLAEDFEAESPIFKTRHFEKALESVCPRTTKEMIDFYENFNSKFCIS